MSVVGGEGNGNPLQYSCLEKPMDRGAWWVTVPGITKSQTQLRDQHHHNPLLASEKWRSSYVQVLTKALTQWSRISTCLQQ